VAHDSRRALLHAELTHHLGSRSLERAIVERLPHFRTARIGSMLMTDLMGSLLCFSIG
jgi:hypothetical protein